jgi:hypothetical protein
MQQWQILDQQRLDERAKRFDEALKRSPLFQEMIGLLRTIKDGQGTLKNEKVSLLQKAKNILGIKSK